MGIVERYKLWSAIRHANETEEAPDVAGGRDAELALRERIGQSFQFKGAEVFAGRRVNSRRESRRREIDLIVCTPQRIHLIEIKNWSGRLEIHGRDWIQERRGGGTINHHDLLAENRLKLDAAVESLRDQGLDFTDDFVKAYIAPIIMFMNANLDMDQRIEALPEVFSRRELDLYLAEKSHKSFSEHLLGSITEYCLASIGRSGADKDHPAIEPKLYKSIVRCFSETATWDQIYFHGSKSITGDLISLRLGDQVLRRPEIEQTAGGRVLSLKWTRNPILGWLKVLTGLGSLGRIRIGKRSIKLGLGDTVFFQDVGERESKTRRLVEIEKLALG